MKKQKVLVGRGAKQQQRAARPTRTGARRLMLHPIMIFGLLCVGVLVVGSTVYGQAASYDVTATVPGVPNTTAPVEATPAPLPPVPATPPTTLQVFQMDAQGHAPGSVPQVSDTPTVTGTAPPYAHVVLTFHSVVTFCKTQADGEGRWRCTLDRALEPGIHTVEIVATTVDGQRLMLPSFTIRAVPGLALPKQPAAPNSDPLPTSTTSTSSIFHIGQAGFASFTGSQHWLPKLLTGMRSWLWLVWPAYIMIIFMVVSFWLGEREEYRRLARAFKRPTRSS